jgi:general secretion pathway protein A
VAGAGLLAAVNQVMREPARALTPVVAKAVPASAPASAPGIAPVAAPAEAPAEVAKATVPAPAASVAAPVLLRDSNEAWRELAQAWKAAPEGRDPCKALQKEQLQCFSKNLNLALIRELGRPGILTLDTETGAPTYAVLTALGRDSATLRAGGTEQTVTLAALAARWHGEFSTLWRAPPGYNSRAAAAPGAETVDWLLARLAATNGAPIPKDRRDADAALRPQLRAFQLAHGLTADGHPGPLTYMQLNRAAGVEEPRLRTEP